MPGQTATPQLVLPGLAKRLSLTPLNDLRFYALTAAILTYAVLGSPTPDAPGLTELVIAALLIAAIPFEAVSALLTPRRMGEKKPENWHLPARLFLIYGATIPVIMAALHGHAGGPVIRDLIPFGFLFLPALYAPLLTDPRRTAHLVALCVCLGLSFSLRGITDIALFFNLRTDPLSYLPNAPTVLFSALYLTGLGGSLIIKRLSLSTAAKAVLVIALAAIPLLAIAGVLQRASLGLFALTILAWLGMALWFHPRQSLRLFIPLALLGMAIAPQINLLYGELLQKTVSVGGNMRLQEWTAVWNAATGNPLTLLFGLGWGGTFASPAVGGITVNFTHGLLSSMLLKTGLTGMMLAALYMVALGKNILHAVQYRPVLALALAGPFAIDTLLYASFKSLDFGLILLLIASLKNRNGQTNPLV